MDKTKNIFNRNNKDKSEGVQINYEGHQQGNAGYNNSNDIEDKEGVFYPSVDSNDNSNNHPPRQNNNISNKNINKLSDPYNDPFDNNQYLNKPEYTKNSENNFNQVNNIHNNQYSGNVPPAAHDPIYSFFKEDNKEAKNDEQTQQQNFEYPKFY